MVQKALPPRPVLCAGNGSQSRAKQPAAHWAGPSRLASASFSGDPFSRSSASASGCVSLTLPPGDRNPKSLKVSHSLWCPELHHLSISTAVRCLLSLPLERMSFFANTSWNPALWW